MSGTARKIKKKRVPPKENKSAASHLPCTYWCTPLSRQKPGHYRMYTWPAHHRHRSAAGSSSSGSGCYQYTMHDERVQRQGQQ